jgi:riboflavin biosynthesis pyrimidine reductase
MTPMKPLEPLYDVDRGADVPLPPELAALYGRLQFPTHRGRPHVVANFVSTLDGVVALDAPGHAGGGPISGFNSHDRLVMGLLRATADAVIVGAGTLRSVPDHVWTAGHICPALAGTYQVLRNSLGKAGPPLTVIVTARGDIDPASRVVRSGEAPVLIVTGPEGYGHIRSLRLPRSVGVVLVPTPGRLDARSILDAVARASLGVVILIEGGPHLLGDFFAASSVDDLFLTLSPQVAGRDGHGDRPGLVAGRTFAPEHPLWGTLVSVKRGGSHLFLRYAFPAPQ